RRASETLAEVKGCYPNESRVRELDDLLKQAATRLHEQGLKLANSTRIEEWEQAFVKARKIEDEFSDGKGLAREIRDKVLAQGKSARSQKLASAKDEQQVPQACTLFKQVYELSQALDRYDPGKGLADGAWTAWYEYGQNFLSSKPEDARKVAESMLVVRKD